MATIIAYPSTIVAKNSNIKDYDLEQIFDAYKSGDSEFIWSTTYGQFIVGGFNFNELPSGAIIEDIKISIIAKMVLTNKNIKLQAVRNASSLTSYTDLGDGQITFVSNSNSWQTVAKSFPSATANLTADMLKNDVLNVRFEANGGGYLRELCVHVVYSLPTYTVHVVANPTEGGTVTGGGTYEAGQTVTLSAKPNTGYKFKQWSDGNTSVNRTVTVSGNATYTAEFERLKYNITATVSPANSGTVSGAGVYSHGDTATLTATAATGFQFVQWSDGETSPTRTQTVTDVASFTAIFEKAATSNTFRGTSRQTVYGGIKEKSVYKGTTKIS